MITLKEIRKVLKEKILSQYDIIRLANMGNQKAKEELEERLKDTTNKDKSESKKSKSSTNHRNEALSKNSR